MKTQGWPWWAIIAQSFGGLAFVAAVLAIDDAYRTAELRSIVVTSDPGPVDPFNWLWLIYMSPYVALFVVVFIVIPAHIIAIAFLSAGLPIRLIPVVRSWWVRYYVPLILLAVSAVLLVIAWLVLPPAHIEVSTYHPSSPVFVVGATVGTFAIWHFWLPRRRDASVPTTKSPRRAHNSERGEEWRIGRLL